MGRSGAREYPAARRYRDKRLGLWKLPITRSTTPVGRWRYWESYYSLVYDANTWGNAETRWAPPRPGLAAPDGAAA